MNKTLTISAFQFSAVVWGTPGLTQQALTAEQIGTEIIGREMDGRMGPFRARLIYAANGTISMSSAVGRGGGTWQICGSGSLPGGASLHCAWARRRTA